MPGSGPAQGEPVSPENSVRLYQRLWQPLPFKHYWKEEAMGSKGTFISPVHRDRQEIEIPAEGGKVAGIAVP